MLQLEIINYVLYLIFQKIGMNDNETENMGNIQIRPDYALLAWEQEEIPSEPSGPRAERVLDDGAGLGGETSGKFFKN